MNAPGDEKSHNVEHIGTSATDRMGREEDAKLSLENTEVSLHVAWILIACLLCTIFFVPMLQLIHESKTAHVSDQQQASTVGRFPSFNILSLIPGLREASGVDKATGLDALLPSVKDLRAYENTLEEQSVVANWILPRAQFLLTDVFGAGNEQVYKGKDNWLFYRSDVDYTTGRGFLTAIPNNKRDLKLLGRQPDPLSAIEDFDRQLRAQGIRLIVVPAVPKPTIHPEMMSSRYDQNSQPVQNPSYAEFVKRLRSRDILVFDTTKVLVDARNQEKRVQFLASDTHWTPKAVEEVAGRLGDFIAKESPLPARQPVGYTRLNTSVSGIGDTAVMLKLPKSADALYQSTEDIHQVRLGGNMWKPDSNADILFLGDSFSNIYSLKGMGWGESAGLVEQLSYRLGRPIDKIAINAGGAYVTRDALRRQLVRDPNRLAGKCVVIYEFAARELSSGDWKMIKLPNTSAEKSMSVSDMPVSQKSKRLIIPLAKNNPSTSEQQPMKPSPAINEGSAKPVIAVPTIPVKKVSSGSASSEMGNTITKAVKKPVDNQIIIQAVVAGKAEAPTPGAVPYADCVIALHLKNISVLHGKVAAKEIVVFIWGMRKNKLTPAASYTNGQRITLRLKPWDAVESTYGSYNRVELEDDNLLMLDVFWGEETK